MSSLVSEEEQNSIDRLEENFLNWIRNASIFFITGVAMLGFKVLRKIAYWIFILSIFLLIITEFDYLAERQLLGERGFKVPYLLDLLWVVTIAAIFLMLWLLFEFFHNKRI